MKRGYLDRPDCRIYYEVTGEGPLLVFAHGLGGNHMSWWQQVPHFRDRYTCVTFAHRGFAPSSAPPGGPNPDDYAGDLAALIDHLGGGDVRLVTQSMGGWCGLEYAFANPARVRALVLTSTAGTIARATSLFGDPEQMPGWARASDATVAVLMAKNVHVAAGERLAREQPAAHFLYQEIDGLSLGLDKIALRARLAATMRRPAEQLRTLAVPTLWLTGDEDIVYPPFLSDVLAPMMPNARVVRVPKAGHSVYFERPAEFNQAVDAFLSKHA
jgi:pimeloyl-ACP methyl ester carboxylesterase